MKIKIAKRMSLLEPSSTIAISTKAGELKASGKDVISFSAGEPDFDTPQKIKDAAIRALEEGKTKYTPVGGTPAIKKAIVAKLKRDNNLDYELDEVCVNVGAKHSLFNVFAALIEEGDEVIIPAPYWVTYPELAKYYGGVSVVVQTSADNKFKLTPNELKKAISTKTKALILTSPCNPTGSTYSKQELKELAEVLKGSNVVVISDEIYEKIIYTNEKFTSTASINDDMLSRTITINGLSKCVSMTGWRFGYVACKDKQLIKDITKLQSQSTSNICSITQEASIVGLSSELDADINKMKEAFRARRDLAVSLLNKIDNLNVIAPDGAFYLFVDISKIEKDCFKFCSELLQDKFVALIPGGAFGMSGYFRLSFVASDEDIKEGISRIGDFIANKY